MKVQRMKLCTREVQLKGYILWRDLLDEVDVPIPQMVEEIVHVPVTQTQNRQGLSSEVM